MSSCRAKSPTDEKLYECKPIIRKFFGKLARFGYIFYRIWFSKAKKSSLGLS